MLPDRVSNPGPLTYESGALLIVLRGPAKAPTNRLYVVDLRVLFFSAFGRAPWVFSW